MSAHPRSAGRAVKPVLADRPHRRQSPKAPATPRSWKVGVKTAGDADWVYNSLRFPTKEQADAYGRDLWSRWTAVTEWESHPSDDAPTEPLAAR